MVYFLFFYKQIIIFQSHGPGSGLNIFFLFLPQLESPNLDFGHL